MYEILIVGGGPAGLTAAIYAARAGKHVAVLERGSTGGQIISAPLVENYPGIPSVSGTELARQMTEQACTFGAEIVYTEAVGLEKTTAGFRVLCMDGVREAKAVILATGAAHRSLGLAAEDALTGCGVSYCAVCDGAFYEGLDVAVVGGGDTAVQDALLLANTCRSVTLIHRRNAFRASAMLVGRAEKQEISGCFAAGRCRGSSAPKTLCRVWSFCTPKLARRSASMWTVCSSQSVRPRRVLLFRKPLR